MWVSMCWVSLWALGAKKLREVSSRTGKSFPVSSSNKIPAQDDLIHHQPTENSANLSQTFRKNTFQGFQEDFLSFFSPLAIAFRNFARHLTSICLSCGSCMQPTTDWRNCTKFKPVDDVSLKHQILMVQLKSVRISTTHLLLGFF